MLEVLQRQGAMGQYYYDYYRSRPWKKLKQLRKRPCHSLTIFSLSALAMLLFVAPRRFSLNGLPVLAEHQINSRSMEISDLYGAEDLSSQIRGLKDASALGDIQLGKRPTMGLVNMDQNEACEWQAYAHGRMPVHFPVAPGNQSLQWSDFYPEWIDEDERFGSPKCPPLPLPRVHPTPDLDLVIARVPCPESGGERNVHRLHVLLSAASVASQQKGESMHVLIISECGRPPLNLFPCRELLRHEGSSWLYLVSLANMRTRLASPVGSCELSFSVKHPDQLDVRTGEEPRQAYVSMVHTESSYVCGAIVLAHSIRQSGSTRDLVMLVDKSIRPEQRQGLHDAGWKVCEIERIRNPYAQNNTYNEWNYSKFRLWQLTQYSKIIFIDSDLVVLRNMDFLFEFPEISASGNDKDRFNSGLMVIEPSTCTFEILMDEIMETRSYNGGDQGYLNEMFPWWHRLPKHLNFLKISVSNDDPEQSEAKSQLFDAEPPVLYAIHYLGTKPWLCFPDYDCNWNSRHRQYASDAAHATWFRIHDRMAMALQHHCWLTTAAKAAREVDRRRAEFGGSTDGHWNITIKDPRLEYCLNPEQCDWQERVKYLLHPPIKGRHRGKAHVLRRKRRNFDLIL